MRGSDTSEAAAMAMMASAKTLRDKVEAVIYISGKRGTTTEEIEQFLGKKHQTISPRVWELKGGGGAEAKVFDSGIRAPNSSGSKAAIIVHKRFEKFHPICEGCGKRLRGDCTCEEPE